MNKLGRAIWILRNEGPTTLAKKTAKVTTKRLMPRKDETGINQNYQYLANQLFNVSETNIETSKKIVSKKVRPVSSAIWFVPYFDHVTYGGIYTIFRFIEAFANKGYKTTIVIFDNKYFDVEKMKKEVANHFPGLIDVQVINFDPGRQNIKDLPAADISFATIWMSAYLLLRYNQTKRKYYFIQDYEPLFYEAGSMYALAESTYRFGFTGVVNTPGLLWALNQRHGLEGVSFIPAVDKQNYYPHPERKANMRTRVFFYARPNNPRNAFELGILIIHQLLGRFGNKIEIVTAGADWDERAYGLAGKITNLGLLSSLKEVGDLYRTCDIGFVFMLSKHPSYQPFEFMACGMATVTNRNEDNLWLFKDGQNCLLAEPSPEDMADKVARLIEDKTLRNKIARAGQKNINLDWQPELDKIADFIKKN